MERAWKCIIAGTGSREAWKKKHGLADAMGAVDGYSVPGIANWRMYAGGTSAAQGKHSYQFDYMNVTYNIDPISSQYGRHLGYSLTASGAHGERGLWATITPEGRAAPFNGHAPAYRSPQAAATAARKHANWLVMEAKGIRA